MSADCLNSEDAPSYLYDAWLSVLKKHSEIKSYDDFVYSKQDTFDEFKKVIEDTFEMLLPIRDGLVD